MAFLDEIDKKLTMMGQGAIQKTKEMSDSARISGMIRNMEIQKKEYLSDLGKLFVVVHRDIANEQEQALIEKIDSLNMEIQINKEQLNQLKGVTQCPNCNAEISKNSMFCNVCGMKIEQKIIYPRGLSGQTCRQCGAALEEGQMFCSSCGVKVEKEMMVEEEIKEETTFRCSNCGNVVDEGSSFCIYCGTTLR